ncbi:MULTISPECIES: DUF2244 domain-containing protein [unclassified Polynucleobacter]|uniref:DUF2244 domain-containing protein n=1 Tax=unclassified Polynucleobacter TaxID=2640945 RepID=UPI00248FB819|nr:MULTISPECIES: DUF2244 domain-containing protein [unclassified Polynucleobacter]
MSAHVRWVFKKNCSFTPKQVGLFYLAQSSLSLIVAGFFLSQGVWLVLPFTILELVVLGIALLIYARHATDYECITLNTGELVIETSSAGSVKRQVFNPTWVRLERLLSPRKLIALVYQGQNVEIGQFMHVSLRNEFLQELRQELKKYV